VQHAGNLLTVSKRLYMGAPGNPDLPRGRQLRQKPSPEWSQQSYDGTHLPYAATISNSASTSTMSHSHTSHQSTTNARHLSTSAETAAGPDIEHVTPKRHLTRSNQLVGGVFLHLTRKKSVTSCSPLFSQKLSHACHYSGVMGNAIHGTYT
jgi:hypothetical protein